MKNNILVRFALKDLKNHKKDTIITLVTIVIVTIMMMVISLVTPLLLNQDIQELQQIYGNYEYSGVFTNDETSQLQKELNQHSLSSCVVYGEYEEWRTLRNDIIKEIQGDPSLLSVQFLQGTMPQNSKQIAMKKSTLNKWGYQATLHEKVLLPCRLPQGTMSLEFELVGIFDETELVDIIVKDMIDKDEGIIYVKGIDEDISFVKDYGFSENGIFIHDGTRQTYQAFLLAIIEVIVIIIAVSLLYGLTVSSYENRIKDYTLLRSVGATKRQTYFVILLQTFLLTVISVIIGTIPVLIISWMMPMFIELPLKLMLTINQLIYNYLILQVIVVMSYFIPARGAVRRSLTGAFEEQEFRYFYYRYKKLHQMRPLYLAWRQLVGAKKKMFSKIFFIALISMTVMSMISKIGLPQYMKMNQKEPMVIMRFNPDEDAENKKIKKDDFLFLEDYCQDIVFYQHATAVIKEHVTYDMHMPDMYDDDRSWIVGHIPQAYCMNNYLKDRYDLKDIQKDQVIFSNGYLNTYELDYNEGDIALMNNKPFEVIQIIDEDFDELMILSAEDYMEYGDVNDYQEVILIFEDIQQKNELLKKEPEKIVHLIDKYGENDEEFINDSYNTYFYQGNDIENLDDEFFLDYLMLPMLIVVAIAVIYIYQFIFELFKQREDIGTYQLLGLTKREIWLIYFYKALMIAGFGFVAGYVYHFLDNYYQYHSLSLYRFFLLPTTNLMYFGITFMVLVVIVVISLLPLRTITKRVGLENKNMRE